MVDATRAALRHAQGKSRDDLERDELLALGLTKLLEIIGEAARVVSDETRGRAPEIPWAKIVGARHILIHEYFQIDRDLLWHTVTVSLPELVPALDRLLQTITSPLAE